MAEKSKRKRIYFLDELRGFAILCMIVHHAFLDVGDVLGLTWGYDKARIYSFGCRLDYNSFYSSNYAAFRL